MTPPIKLRRLYKNAAKTGDFVIVAEPLPAAVHARMTDVEHMKRRDAERIAISDEWARLGMRQLAIPPDCDAIAAAVSKDHPDWSPSRRLSEAMRRTKGSANPHMMSAAIAAYDEAKK